VRPDRLEVQLDPATHAGLSPAEGAALAEALEGLAQAAGRPLPVTLAVYSRGSAFIPPPIRAV
jgi:hypothetical protein